MFCDSNLLAQDYFFSPIVVSDPVLYCRFRVVVLFCWRVTLLQPLIVPDAYLNLENWVIWSEEVGDLVDYCFPLLDAS